MITRLIATLLCLGLLLGDLPAFAASLARLTEIKGDVQVLPKGGAWHPARVDEELGAGDAVRTGAQSSATIVRKDGTELELMAFAQLAVEDEAGFLLSAGRVWSHFVKSLGLPFYIRTPNATALVRGTTLGVGYEEARSRVVVYEGLVEVQGRDGMRQEVAGGFRLDVDREGRLERLERAAAQELEEGRGFRVRRGLEAAPQRSLVPGAQGKRPDRGEDDKARGRDSARREEPRRERAERAGRDAVEGLERRMERIERRLGERLNQREARETLERERREAVKDLVERQLGGSERQERQERQEQRGQEQAGEADRQDGPLRDVVPGVRP